MLYIYTYIYIYILFNNRVLSCIELCKYALIFP